MEDTFIIQFDDDDLYVIDVFHRKKYLIHRTPSIFRMGHQVAAKSSEFKFFFRLYGVRPKRTTTRELAHLTSLHNPFKNSRSSSTCSNLSSKCETSIFEQILWFQICACNFTYSTYKMLTNYILHSLKSGIGFFCWPGFCIDCEFSRHRLFAFVMIPNFQKYTEWCENKNAEMPQLCDRREVYRTFQYARVCRAREKPTNQCEKYSQMPVFEQFLSLRAIRTAQLRSIDF